MLYVNRKITGMPKCWVAKFFVWMDGILNQHVNSWKRGGTTRIGRFVEQEIFFYPLHLPALFPDRNDLKILTTIATIWKASNWWRRNSITFSSSPRLIRSSTVSSSPTSNRSQGFDKYRGPNRWRAYSWLCHVLLNPFQMYRVTSGSRPNRRAMLC